MLRGMTTISCRADPVTERGPGFTTAAVTDPFGNLLGVLYNQHFLDMLAQDAAPRVTDTTERSLA